VELKGLTEYFSFELLDSSFSFSQLMSFFLHISFQFDDMDDLDYRDEERNFDNDRTQNPTQNVTKLNYHSYMNKQTRGKWSKSDTDMFYKVFFRDPSPRTAMFASYYLSSLKIFSCMFSLMPVQCFWINSGPGSSTIW
jgi:hypothetical protein